MDKNNETTTTPPAAAFDAMKQHQASEYPPTDAANDYDPEDPKSTISQKENGNDDNDEEYVHDQLPSVEEAKATIPHRPKSESNKKDRKTNFLLPAIAAFLFLNVILAATAGSRREAEEDAMIHSTTDGRADRILTFLFENEVSKLPSLKSGTTAHHHAALFIADGDVYQMKLNEETKDQFVERYVLALLYYHLNGPRWTHQLDFLSGKDHCEWWKEFQTNNGQTIRQGVECNENGQVIKLNLGWNNLSADDGYPTELKFLQKLDTFHAEFNHVHGYFPEAFQFMPHLKSIALMKSGLSGSIPNWIGDMTLLTSLGLGSNSLGGTIPSTMSRLKSLKVLGLDDNHLHGNVIDILKPLKKLQALYLEHNSFTGSLEGTTDKWPVLKELDVSMNMLDGHLDSTMLNHPNLVVLDIEHNFIDGSFPNGGLENNHLEYINMRHNQIHGSLPDRLGFIHQLQHFDIAGNSITGTIPNTIQQLYKLKYFATGGNDFTEQPMLDVSNLSNLVHLDLKGNNIIGHIPDDLGDLEFLKLLDLSNNGFKGGIPTWLGLLRGLNFLLSNENELTGQLPSTLSNMRQLKVLAIEGNEFHGTANAICENSSNNLPSYFSADCYAGPNGEPAEISCQCCTTCCIANDPSCTSVQWHSNYDPISRYGSNIRSQYDFDLHNAPMTYSAEQIEEVGDAMDALP